MRFRYSFTFEHDSKPTHTVRGEFEKDDYEAAFKSAVFLAAKQAPKAKWRSYVCVVEAIGVEATVEAPEETATAP